MKKNIYIIFSLYLKLLLKFIKIYNNDVFLCIFFLRMIDSLTC